MGFAHSRGDLVSWHALFSNTSTGFVERERERFPLSFSFNKTCARMILGFAQNHGWSFVDLENEREGTSLSGFPNRQSPIRAQLQRHGHPFWGDPKKGAGLLSRTPPGNGPPSPFQGRVSTSSLEKTPRGVFSCVSCCVGRDPSRGPSRHQKKGLTPLFLVQGTVGKGLTPFSSRHTKCG